MNKVQGLNVGVKGRGILFTVIGNRQQALSVTDKLHIIFNILPWFWRTF